MRPPGSCATSQPPLDSSDGNEDQPSYLCVRAKSLGCGSFTQSCTDSSISQTSTDEQFSDDFTVESETPLSSVFSFCNEALGVIGSLVAPGSYSDAVIELPSIADDHTESTDLTRGSGTSQLRKELQACSVPLQTCPEDEKVPFISDVAHNTNFRVKDLGIASPTRFKKPFRNIFVWKKGCHKQRRRSSGIQSDSDSAMELGYNGDSSDDDSGSIDESLVSVITFDQSSTLTKNRCICTASTQTAPYWLQSPKNVPSSCAQVQGNDLELEVSSNVSCGPSVSNGNCDTGRLSLDKIDMDLAENGSFCAFAADVLNADARTKRTWLSQISKYSKKLCRCGHVEKLDERCENM